MSGCVVGAWVRLQGHSLMCLSRSSWSCALERRRCRTRRRRSQQKPARLSTGTLATRCTSSLQLLPSIPLTRPHPQFCPACARPIRSVWAGWKRSCIPGEAGESGLDGAPTCLSRKGVHNFSYPRTDPVVIMAVLSPDGEKILLGRQRSWPARFYSCLAGFIESGESLEEAVRREVYEEAGIVIGEVGYHSSQPCAFFRCHCRVSIADSVPQVAFPGLAHVWLLGHRQGRDGHPGGPRQRARGCAFQSRSGALTLLTALPPTDARFFTREQVLNVINSTKPMQLSREQVARLDGKEGVSGKDVDAAKAEARDEGSFLMPPACVHLLESCAQIGAYAPLVRLQHRHCQHARHRLGNGQALQPGACRALQDVDRLSLSVCSIMCPSDTAQCRTLDFVST